MEINSYPDRLDLSAEHIRLARRFGVRFSLGTDAHAAEQLRYMRYGVAQARRGLGDARRAAQRAAVGDRADVAEAGEDARRRSERPVARGRAYCAGKPSCAAPMRGTTISPRRSAARR